MSDYPRVGDKVRVTYEGTVTKADDLLHRYIDVDGRQLRTHPAEIEVLEKAGPRPGAVAISPSGAVYVQRGFDSVFAVYPKENFAINDDLSGGVSDYGTVIHEPSA